MSTVSDFCRCWHQQCDVGWLVEASFRLGRFLNRCFLHRFAHMTKDQQYPQPTAAGRWQYMMQGTRLFMTRIAESGLHQVFLHGFALLSRVATALQQSIPAR